MQNENQGNNFQSASLNEIDAPIKKLSAIMLSPEMPPPIFPLSQSINSGDPQTVREKLI